MKRTGSKRITDDSLQLAGEGLGGCAEPPQVRARLEVLEIPGAVFPFAVSLWVGTVGEFSQAIASTYEGAILEGLLMLERFAGGANKQKETGAEK